MIVVIGVLVALTAAGGRAVGTQGARAAVPRAPARAGTVHEDVFYSAALGARKHVVIYLPPSYTHDVRRRFPVAYYLHGLSGSETDWVSKGGIDGVADSLFAAGAPETILVLPDGDDGWYTTWTTQVPYAACADTLRSEAPERYCVSHERYDDYAAHDVVAYVDAHYRTINAPAHRGIGGLSMGGYGAVTLALAHPDVFGAAASHSGVVSPMYTGPHPYAGPPTYASAADDIRPTTPFWPRYLLYWGTDITRWRSADPATLAARAPRVRSDGGRLPALFIDCGRDDGFIDQNRAPHAELTRLGVAHEYHEWPGAHTWRYWSTHVRQSLAWMARQIG